LTKNYSISILIKMKKLLFIILIASTFMACEKENFDAAKFRCKIDGNPFIAADDLISVSYTAANNSFYIQASKILLVNPNNELSGEMKLDFSLIAINTPINLGLQNTWRWSNNGDETYRSNNNNQGTLTITAVDYTNKTIQGEFSLTAYNDNATKTKSITEGNFNLDWD